MKSTLPTAGGQTTNGDPPVRRARWCWLLTAYLLAGLLPWFATGCGRSFSRADLVFANGGEAETLDPALMTAQLDMRLAYALFED